MEAALRQALLRAGTSYRAMPPELLASLARVAEACDLEPRQAARAFDKFWVTTRQDKAAFEEADVQAFRAEQMRGAAKAAAPAAARTFDNIITRPALEDVVMVDSKEDVPAAAAHGSGGEQRPSQRITPYLKAGSRPGSAGAPRSAGKPLTPASSGKFAERQQPGAVVATLNPEIEAQAPGEAMETDAEASGRPGGCEVRILGAPLRAGEHYMVDRIEDRVAYCERRIVALESEVPAAAVAEGSEGSSEAAEAESGVHPVGVACQQPALFAGRIVCDAEEGRMNAASLLLEGSQRSSEGVRVKLDVSKCAAGVRLFPGQTVLVRGTNPSGYCVVASEVLPGLPAPMASTPLPELAAAAATRGGRGLSVVVAAGPYTLADDLAYEPLAALLDYCRAQRPDVLLLAGPFVDDQHPRIKDGQLDVLFEDLYQSAVVEPLRAFCASAEGAGTRVLLLPAARDAHHHPVFPQPPLPEVAGAPAITPLANPATLALDEVVLGVSSADWLFGVSSAELAQGPAAGGDRMAALAGHLLSQRSYYPMFPPPLGACFDSTKARALELAATPDLLVTPSQLAPFAKLVPVAAGGLEGAAQQAGSVVCINPGRLAKGSTGGTFAHFYIAPHKEAAEVAAGGAAATNAPVPHRVDERCRVEIRRI